MRRKTISGWPAWAVVILGVGAAFATGAYVATKFVSPCVCVCMQAAGRIQ